MEIIGITGPIGHGKSTLAAMLQKREPKHAHLESSQIIAEVVSALNQCCDVSRLNVTDVSSINTWLSHLPAILAKHVHLHTDPSLFSFSQEQLVQNAAEHQKLFVYIDRIKDAPYLLKESIDESNKEDFRPMLQWLGGYVVKHISKTAWYDEIMRRAYSLRKQGIGLLTVSGLRFPTDGQVLRAGGGSVIRIVRPDYQAADITDITERESSSIEADAKVINNGNLTDLDVLSVELWQDLQNGALRPVYEAVSGAQIQ